MMRVFLKAALAAAVVLSAAALYAAEALGPNFQVLSVSPGLGSRQRARSTLPVAVEMQVAHTPVSGRIAVRSSFNSESVPEYVVPFDISPGASYLFTLYPFCQSESEDFTLTIEDKSGRQLRRETLHHAPTRERLLLHRVTSAPRASPALPSRRRRTKCWASPPRPCRSSSSPSAPAAGTPPTRSSGPIPTPPA